MKISSGQQKIIVDSGDREETKVTVEGGAKLLYILTLLGGKKEKKIDIRLAGSGAQCEVIGLFYGQKKDQFKIDSTTTCEAPLTYCKVLVKGVLTGQASCFFRGLVRIDEQALNSEGYLFQRTLLLSKHARAQSLPYLEVNTNQVKAQHAVTISRPDQEQLLYLQSRGLEPKLSQKLMVQSFLTEVMDFVPSKQANEIRAKLKAL